MKNKRFHAVGLSQYRENTPKTALKGKVSVTSYPPVGQRAQT
jgi:hypothetical protein